MLAPSIHTILMSNWQNIRAYAAAVQRHVVKSNVGEKEKEKENRNTRSHGNELR